MKMIKSCGTKATMLALICASAFSSQTGVKTPLDQIQSKIVKQDEPEFRPIETDKIRMYQERNKYYIDMKIIPPQREEDQTIHEFSFEIQPKKPFIFGRRLVQKCVPEHQKRFGKISGKHVQIDLLQHQNGTDVSFKNLSFTNAVYFNDKEVPECKKGAKPESYDLVRMPNVQAENTPVQIKYEYRVVSGKSKVKMTGWIHLSYRGYFRVAKAHEMRAGSDEEVGPPSFDEVFTALPSMEARRLEEIENAEDSEYRKQKKELEEKEEAEMRKGDEGESTIVGFDLKSKLTDGNAYYIDVVSKDFAYSFELEPGRTVKFGCYSFDYDSEFVQMDKTMSHQHLEFSFVDDSNPQKGIIARNLTVDKRPTYIFYGQDQEFKKLKRGTQCNLTEFTRNGKALAVPYQRCVMDEFFDNEVTMMKFSCRGTFQIPSEVVVTDVVDTPVRRETNQRRVTFDKATMSIEKSKELRRLARGIKEQLGPLHASIVDAEKY